MPVWEGIRTSFTKNDKRINMPAGGFVDGLEWERWGGGIEANNGTGAACEDDDATSGAGVAYAEDDASVGGGGDVPQQGHTFRGSAGGGLIQDDDDAPPGAGLKGLANEYAVGHMINHPSEGQEPNVMDWALRFDLDDLEAAGVPRHRVPYAVHPVWCVAQHVSFFDWVMTYHTCTASTPPARLVP